MSQIISMSAEDRRNKVLEARKAVEPLTKIYAKYRSLLIPKIIIHPTGRLEPYYSDKEKKIMANFEQQIQDLFLSTIKGPQSLL